MILLNRLQETNSPLEKQTLLYGLTELEINVFKYAYHPDAIYYMKFDSINDYFVGEPSEGMFGLLSKIIDKEISGNDAKTKVNTFAAINGELIKLIINKDLRCGVTATIFNKVYPGTIPQFKVQLAKEVDIKTIKYPVLAQLKYDGVRLIAMIENGIVIFKTRNGKIVNLPDLAIEINKLPFINYILDGEVVLDSGLQEDRTKISGMINSAMHGGIIDEHNVVFHIFDTMSLNDFNVCKCTQSYEIRFGNLATILDFATSNMLQMAQTAEIHNVEAANELYEASLALGYEGLVLKYPEHLYTFKRSKDWIKVKEVKHADLLVLKLLEGTGKYEGMIGALHCGGKVEGKDVIVDVGSGLSDLQRTMNDIYFLGETVEVKYNAVIQDSVTKEWSLFLPRFVQVRFDLGNTGS